MHSCEYIWPQSDDDTFDPAGELSAQEFTEHFNTLRTLIEEQAAANIRGQGPTTTPTALELGTVCSCFIFY